MKIEKLNENQIRCTLNKSDLASRQLKINELAYGSDKAKELFRDMMQQASYELGFEADNMPIMIEAIPISPECIVLIVTKVENPEELDTRFSRFSPSYTDSDDDLDFDDMETIGGDGYSSSSSLPTANEELEAAESEEAAASESNVLSDERIANIFNKIKQYINEKYENADAASAADNNSAQSKFVPLNESIKKSANHQIESSSVQDSGTALDNMPGNRKSAFVRVFSFDNFDNICDAARVTDNFFHGSTMLYKQKKDSSYYLIVKREQASAVDFNKVCNILSEYGTKESNSNNAPGFFSEHCDCVIAKHALHILSRM